ncbi:MAG: PaaI family thioesterase [Alphaproteobacteria bacterium]|nr:PaaI family thioesterase [Alphaproteobacteria bacterium]
MTDEGQLAKTAFGVPPVETLRAMSGLEFLRAIVAGRLPAPPIAEVLRFRLVEVEQGRAVFQGVPDRAFYNPIGSVHGGYAATLLDSCMGCAVHSTLNRGQGYATLEIKVNLVRALTEATGLVRAEGRILHSGRTTATAEGKLTDAGGKLYAHGTTTCTVFAL